MLVPVCHLMPSVHTAEEDFFWAVADIVVFLMAD